jgi:hypothetical protein
MKFLNFLLDELKSIRNICDYRVYKLNQYNGGDEICLRVG